MPLMYWIHMCAMGTLFGRLAKVVAHGWRSSFALTCSSIARGPLARGGHSPNVAPPRPRTTRARHNATLTWKATTIRTCDCGLQFHWAGPLRYMGMNHDRRRAHTLASTKCSTRSRDGGPPRGYGAQLSISCIARTNATQLHRCMAAHRRQE